MAESRFHFSEEQPLRWGVIGCGSVAEKKSVPAYKNNFGFHVDMIMRRSSEKAEDYAKRHHIPEWTTNADEVINNPNIDAVYIATPPDTHKFYALKVAAAGKPCCVEKPMAPNYVDSLAIYEAFEAKGIPLFVAYYRRSLPRFLQIKQWLDDGRIGEVRHIHWQKTKAPNEIDLSKQYSWRTDAAIAKGGYFDDLASHGLDLFNFLLGDIVEAKGFAANQLGLYSAFDAVSANWVHTGGVTGTGNWNFGTYHRTDKVEILGCKGSIRFAVLDEAPIELENASGHQVLEIPHPEHIQEFHVQNVKNHLMGNGEHPSTGKTGLHTSWVMDKILGSL
ncbi:Gfo/Idh/MocA family protein [Flagellimonas profundi]|uniref:Gfo/Idh/MocA family oxidoreductase n=1 Tax=Flagellimonas profundi TaxID=2915620 RepID=A0ABS3FF48_9FLAO|nr:Gfo/Idh/MocA family oxidoreductase [Allomuricauda profundi]MBO0341794.1 Gfo/Idh/MocA family oxidoreductase [Allomuricauda profundi]